VLPVDDVPRTSQEALDDAERLLAEERPFAAHEVLEGAWKSAPVDERDLWQGLAQVAVALTHAQRGNAVGASALLERAHERLGAYAGTTPHDIDVDGVLQRLVEYAASIQRSGLPIPLQMRLRVR
jgi:predicted metal-dependent hydrolase